MLRHEYPLLLKTIFSCLITLQTCTLCTGQNTNPHSCPPSSCGNIPNISYPFRLKNDPPHCGDPHYELECQHNTTVLVYLESHKYLVQEINYLNHTIRLIHPSMSQNDICSFPNYSSNYVAIPDVISFGNYFAYRSPFLVVEEKAIYYLPTRKMDFISCPQPFNNSQFVDVGAECGHTSFNYGLNVSGITNKHMYIGYLTDDDATTWSSKLKSKCTIHFEVMLEPSGDAYIDKGNLTLSKVHRFLVNGSTLSWATVLCGGKCQLCYIDGPTARCFGSLERSQWCFFGTITSFRCGFMSTKFVIAFNYYTLKYQNGITYAALAYLSLRTLIGIALLLLVIIHKLRRQHLSTFDIIEVFLQNTNNNLMPIRYSYRDIKRMTSGFRHKLGQGGYGSVYKGKLRS
ncbi:kinase, partial [Striga asiatica]